MSCQRPGASLRLDPGSGEGSSRSSVDIGLPDIPLQLRAGASRLRRRWPWVAGAAVLLAVAASVALYIAGQTRGHLTQARALLDRYDKQASVDQAIGLLSSIVSSRPNDAVARTMLAEAHWRKFEYNPQDAALAARAGEQAGIALTLDQSYAPAHVVLAMINYGQGRFDGALGEAQTSDFAGSEVEPRMA